MHDKQREKRGEVLCGVRYWGGLMEAYLLLLFCEQDF
jgi:hypothetical protein